MQREFGGGRLRESRDPEVDLAVPQPNIERITAEPQGSRGVESGTIYQPSSGQYCGWINRQRRQANKYSHGKRGDAEVQVNPPEPRPTVLQATSHGTHTHSSNQASCLASPIFSVSHKAPGPDNLSCATIRLL